MNLTKLVRDTRIQVSFALMAVWVLAIWNAGTINSFLYPLLSVFAVSGSDILITKIRFRKTYLPASSLVTGFLIGLIISPTEALWVIVLASLLASLSKQFLGQGIRRHIFNPAAFGIIIVNLMFGVPVAWWGVAWSQLPILILIPVMLFVLYRLKRLFMPITFLAVYFIYFSVTGTPAGAFKGLLDGTVMLFVLVMLPEPITSPNWGYFKYLFGALVAVLTIFIPKFVPLSDSLLPALLFSNLIAWMTRLKPTR